MKTATTGPRGGRPVIMGSRGVVSAGHYLGAEAGLSMLRRGGNAMDAAAAVGFALTVLLPQQNGLAGEAPMLVYSSEEDKTWALSGHGTAPRAATLAQFERLGLDIIPGDGLLGAIVPPAVASWILLLQRFGTMRLSEVLAPAIELAEGGFAMFDSLGGQIEGLVDRFRRDWPSSAENYLVNGQVPGSGNLWVQRELAGTLRRLSRADRRFKSRDAGLRAAHEAFYQGPIAKSIVRFCKSTSVPDAAGSHKGLLSLEDLAGFEAKLEEPVTSTYRGFRVFKCSSWTQGPVLLQSLNLLEGFNNLAGMGHNSTKYIHTVVECMKLAYADREFYYGDPDFVRVPLKKLLSKAYSRQRQRLVNPRRASLKLRPGNHPAMMVKTVLDELGKGGGRIRPKDGDTTSIQVIDRAGNVVSVVPSGGWLQSSPAIPGLGFPLGTRGQMFILSAGHPNCLEPGKRPRTTLTPTLAGRLGSAPHLAIGSPGGDCQDQWTLQFFLNVVEFEMSLQEAVEAATFWTGHFPASFYPRTAEPGSLYVESRVPKRCRDELAKRGHLIRPEAPWAGGNTMAVSIDRKTGVICGAASPRYDPAYAVGF
ncbi:MAG: gamma-glutamyltransferase family protein [Phycisphaerae bacterium]|nr:gamma-glutamyltransferase family protein [Phycisphaerae bacterium]